MSTIYDKASLVMIPSGYKDDKLYSIKPTDGSGDFTFSRDGSGASPATRVNASGLIEKGRTNEATYSNTFSDASYVKVNASLTQNATDYNGVANNAWTFSKSAANGQFYKQVTLSEVNTFSIYAKSGSLNWMRLLVDGGGGEAFFDLQNGAIGTTSFNNIDATIEPVGSGWYRCSVTCTSVTYVNAYPADADGIISGTSGSILISFNQVEKGLVATDYIETTTTAVSAGLLGDMPRLDYSGGASCPSLLLEPSRTNRVIHSEYLNGLDKYNISVTSNALTSPEGVDNATLMVENAVLSGFYEISDTIGSTTSGQSYTSSVFVKQGTGTRNIGLGLSAAAFANGRYAIFNLANEEVVIEDGTARGAIESVGNDWYRISVTGVASASVTYGAGINMANGTLFTYDGDGTSSFYLYGFQVEEGSYPTSYIPTYGTATGRAADVATKTSASSIIGQTEGSVFMEVDMQNLDKAGQIFMELYQDANNRFGIAPYWDSFLSENRMQLYQFFSGALQVNIQETITSGVIKVAFAYKQNDYVLYINGTQVGSDTSASVPSTSTIYLGSNGSSLFLGNGVKQALVFPTRLTNAELAALTA